MKSSKSGESKAGADTRSKKSKSGSRHSPNKNHDPGFAMKKAFDQKDEEDDDSDEHEDNGVGGDDDAGDDDDECDN